ncbi:N-acetylmuramate alpha-1-phosphate uridylyltransferase MurU [Pararobbsia alpina]|uniref:N-acetylmuramate alpha-1-phosphate uridylyltransferase n=1 Tax=Pararobbsia alpina TaxID=621374 RepID=A0A6S7B571_9BURK|nr:nucleotidyltransferase family protein [Pararobbsia alpina]CAB3779758.1 N-acetylmuramate alpha-1-phosphate uridylyltransferase [Pararobbsia alpina]
MTTLAMIFAAGRGDRMRPLTDHCPKPLLEAGGKPLIVWQIESLARAGFKTIVINHAWLGEQFEARLGDGSQWGVTLRYSAEHSALETAGGIAQALPLLEPAGTPSIFVAIAGDLYTAFDYASLLPTARRMAGEAIPGMHLVVVPNPPYHPRGDFTLREDGWLVTDESPRWPRLTFGSIGVYDSRMFHTIVPGTQHALTPYFFDTIAQGRASGERYDGLWRNVGTPAHLAEIDALLRAAEGPGATIPP